MKFYGFNLAEGSKVTNLVVPSGFNFPSNPDAGELFFKTSDNTMYIYQGSEWVAHNAYTERLKTPVSIKLEGAIQGQINDFDGSKGVSIITNFAQPYVENQIVTYTTTTETDKLVYGPLDVAYEVNNRNNVQVILGNVEQLASWSPCDETGGPVTNGYTKYIKFDTITAGLPLVVNYFLSEPNKVRYIKSSTNQQTLVGPIAGNIKVDELSMVRVFIDNVEQFQGWSLSDANSSTPSSDSCKYIKFDTPLEANKQVVVEYHPVIKKLFYKKTLNRGVKDNIIVGPLGDTPVAYSALKSVKVSLGGVLIHGSVACSSDGSPVENQPFTHLKFSLQEALNDNTTLTVVYYN